MIRSLLVVMLISVLVSCGKGDENAASFKKGQQLTLSGTHKVNLMKNLEGETGSSIEKVTAALSKLMVDTQRSPESLAEELDTEIQTTCDIQLNCRFQWKGR